MHATDNELGEAQYYGCCGVELYNGWRPHRSLDLTPASGRASATTWTDPPPMTLKRRESHGSHVVRKRSISLPIVYNMIRHVYHERRLCCAPGKATRRSSVQEVEPWL